ncbi:MAG: hypothetical protein JXR69_09915 [Candidatus Delongbacteria bacterium]|nr:hypothetical protein [Candidatus Delongbacteria bacterium]
MKKVVMILSIFAMFGFANAQFSNGITSEVPNLRVNAMGGIYSLVETSNFADFPQRLLTGQEGAWLGKAGGDVWGLARFNLNNFVELPMPMAWQISAEQNSMVTVNDVFDYVGLDFWPANNYDPNGFWNMAYESTNRINSNFAIGINDNLIAGLGIKMYSNGNSDEEDYNDSLGWDYDWNNSFWGLETTWGATMVLDENHFVDASIDFDIWSFSSEYTVDGVDQYEEGIMNCDGIMNFGLNGRYYAKGDKVDYAPYMKFNYFSFASSQDTETAPDVFEAVKFDGSLMNFTLGSGIHYKPAAGVNVYNEFEFRYQSISQGRTNEINTWSEEGYETRMTLLPTYRMGVELTKEIDPKTWWGFNSVQLWGGFNKTFDNVWSYYSWDNDEDDDFDYEDSWTDPTFENVSVTTGAALQNGNFKIEFETTVGQLTFDQDPLSNMALGLVYMFN